MRESMMFLVDDPRPFITGDKSMPGTNTLQQSVESYLENYTESMLPPLRHQWPLLGKELFVLEHTLTDTPGTNRQPLTESEKREKRAAIRNAVVTQLFREEGTYTRDTRYLAFLLIKAGRGGAIVGNPYTIARGDMRQELPYTGLEGYYAGSERTPERGGMTPEEIIQEEANIGAQTLKGIKKHAIAQNSWVTYSHLKHALEEEKPGLEELRAFRVLWSAIVRQLHVRIFHNAEFELTLAERIEQLEQLLSGLPGRTAEEKQSVKDIRSECDRLKRELENLGEAERENERRVRRTRERIRSDRLAEFQRFREETYQALTEPEQERYLIGVQDASLEEATILETINLPKTPDRNTYPPTPVHLTLEQLEGYLFLARLGEIGGDPLARSVLVSQ
jgi:hypothetical protein